MADIFFSYSRKDRNKVALLVGLLEKQGFTVWWDPAIETGERFSPIIHGELDKASCVIVGWSAKSVQSDWVCYEAGTGRARNVLLPVSLDGADPPFGFQQLQTQHFEQWSGDEADDCVQHLMASVHRLVGHPGRHSAVPAAPVLSVAPAVPAAQARRRKKPIAVPNRRVFLIAASTNEEWQMMLNTNLLLSLRRLNLSCTALVPSEDHFLGEGQALQQEVLKDASDYSGGVAVISGWPDERTGELIKFALELQKPVVFVDQNPPADTEKSMPWNMSFVSVSDAEGGRLAAEAVLELAEERPIKRILVVSGFAKQTRYIAFRETISEKLGCDIVVTEDGKFDRWIAENVAYRELTGAIKDDQPFDLVFCTADSMTLGCLDAIDRIERWRRCPRPLVIGYDGATTTQHLAANSGSFLVRLVVQDTKEIARVAAEQLARMRQGEAAARINWVKPYLFPRLRASSTRESRKAGFRTRES